jgi:putative transposase
LRPPRHASLCSFNPYADIDISANRLPHWQKTGAVYFVTFRLADALPYRLLTQWEAERENWLRHHREPWTFEIEREYHERFSRRIEHWLDAGHGSCLLRGNDYANIVAETLRFFDDIRVKMISFVVMPNHVHALFVQNIEWLLQKLLSR